MFCYALRKAIVKDLSTLHALKCLFSGKGIGPAVLSSSHSNFVSLKESHQNQFLRCHFSTDPVLAGEKLVSESLNDPTKNTPTEDVAKLSQNPLFENINYQEIAGTDEELLEKLKFTVDQMRRMDGDHCLLPTEMKLDQWRELLKLKSFHAKKRYLHFISVKKIRKEMDKIKKVQKRELRLEKWRQEAAEKKDDDNPYKYALGKNSLFLRVYDNAIDDYSNLLAHIGRMFEPTIIIDCSYDEFMSGQEVMSCAKQLVYLLSFNRSLNSPLHAFFCNFNPESDVAKKLHSLIPTLYEDFYPFYWTSKSYMEYYPKEKFVYLTPHCSEVLTTVSHDDIYIIGAMVDKKISEPMSLAKAKENGIRYAKLPLDDYLAWGTGTKSLTINQCGNIVQSMLTDGCWEKALKAVPKRKMYKTVDDKLVAAMKKHTGGRNLKLHFKRNMPLYEHLVKESNGELVDIKKVKGSWPH